MPPHRHFQAAASAGALLLLLALRNAGAQQELDGAIHHPARAEEEPIVLSVAIEGGEVISAARIERELLTRPGSRLSRERLAADREAIESEYAEEGFPLAHAESLVRLVPLGRAEVTFRIDEGPRLRLHEIEFAGGESFSRRELIAACGLEPVRGFGFLSRGDYRPGSIGTAAARLVRFYRSRGFFDVEVALDGFRIDDLQRRISVELRIVEGARYRLAGCDVRGQKLLPRELLLEELDLETGGAYRGEEVEAAARRLILAYQKRSDVVPDVRVSHRWRGDEEVIVVFEIEERPHRFIRRIDISGNWKTRDRVIRRRLAMAPGDVLLPVDVEESLAHLEQSGLFAGVEILPRATGEENAYDIEVAVEETEHRGRFALGGGASSGAGEVAYVQIQSLNFDIFRLPRGLTDWRGAFAGGDQKLE
ncbi:MAG: hypothetical protein JXA90_02890, partial [Planctomycetes bacterium]|nr:hypothetical protein [Planctomycetota bacterium]